MFWLLNMLAMSKHLDTCLYTQYIGQISSEARPICLFYATNDLPLAPSIIDKTQPHLKQNSPLVKKKVRRNMDVQKPSGRLVSLYQQAFTMQTDKKYNCVLKILLSCFCSEVILRIINRRKEFDHKFYINFKRNVSLVAKTWLHILVHMITNVQTQLALTKVCVVIRFHTPFASHAWCIWHTVALSSSFHSYDWRRSIFYYLANKLVAVLFGFSVGFLVKMWASIVLLPLNPRKLL